MNLFSKIFGSGEANKNEEKKTIPWKSLTTMEQLDTIEKESKTRPQVIFKHSTRCGISRMALNGFERGFGYQDNQVDLYFLDLLNYRDLSQEIASRFQVWHESPQMIIIKNGETVAHQSHSAINAELINPHLD
ncbi:bacillithiol system redox-active protein YtxJ [Aquimarina brevivitae]|uniref:Bacillithiol system protein YtxJ n=1 Tax=Aquimarina brevivitae TaxID=323412 RepID=A0A4V2F5E9_9FLAO|nr:bacillithiol system redox-active protein YtxJ [Aquimarina brevivitae]RZS92579.1 bacillithiol system protein YtxJ [Aquimarina brevivitae]